VPGLSLGALLGANYRFIACFSDRPHPAAWILLHGDAVDIGCAPSGNDRLNFHSGRLKLNLVTNLLAYDRATAAAQVQTGWFVNICNASMPRSVITTPRPLLPSPAY